MEERRERREQRERRERRARRCRRKAAGAQQRSAATRAASTRTALRPGPSASAGREESGEGRGGGGAGAAPLGHETSLAAPPSTPGGALAAAPPAQGQREEAPCPVGAEAEEVVGAEPPCSFLPVLAAASSVACSTQPRAQLVQ